MNVNTAKNLFSSSLQYIALDRQAIDHAHKQFAVLRKIGIVKSGCEFDDAVWYTTNEYSNVGIHFQFNELSYKNTYEKVFDLQLADFSQYTKAYVISLFGRYALESIRSFVLDIRHIIDTPISEICAGAKQKKKVVNTEDISCVAQSGPEGRSTIVKKETAEEKGKDANSDALSLYKPMLCIDFISSLPTARCKVIEDLVVALEDYNDVTSGEQRNLAALDTYLSFDEIIKRFWASELTIAERLFYFPLYLWWILTAIIPLRPHEFLLLARNCLTKNSDGTYILKFRRNKIKGSKRYIGYKISDDYIEQELVVPPDIGDLLQEYIAATAQYSATEINTLFLADPHYYKWGRKKFSRSRFLTYTNLTTILRCFYKEIIVEKYKYRIVDDSRDQYLGDHEIGTIHLGDARHLAMINAMQSGATPVVAMLLAGHSNMAMGAHYYTNLTRMIECRTHREYRKYLNGDASYNLIPAAGALPLPTESCPLQDGGRCYSQAYQEGRVDDCKEVLGPRGEIGYCPQCRYYRCDHDSFWGADDHYKREIQSDLKLLRDSAQLVREGKGYQEDIYEALLKLQASTLSYQAFLIDKMKNNY